MLKLISYEKYAGDCSNLINDYSAIFWEKYHYDIKNCIKSIFYKIDDTKKKGYVLLDATRPVGIILYHIDSDVSVVHFFHILKEYAHVKTFKIMFKHFFSKIKLNIPKIVFTTEIFNYGEKQLKSMMAVYDFEQKERAIFSMHFDNYKVPNKLVEDIVFKPFTYDLIEDISELSYFSFAGSMELEIFPVGFDKEDFIQEIQNITNNLYGKFSYDDSVVVYNKDELVGAILSVVSDNILIIHLFFIAPKNWGKKIGYNMLKKYIAFIYGKNRYSHVVTAISMENLKVIELLEKMGFSKEATVRLFSRILK